MTTHPTDETKKTKTTARTESAGSAGSGGGNRGTGGTEKSALRAPLGVLAAATATHGTGRADDIALPKLPGFVESAFSPLVYDVARQCLSERPGDGARTAVALVSLMGDTTTADLASRRMVSGRVHNPLLFMQATPNSVLGLISREFGITGQMLSFSSLDDPLAELLAMADLLLEDPELDRVLALGVELGGGERLADVHRELATADGDPAPAPALFPVPDLPPTAGLAAAVLLGRSEATAPVRLRSAGNPAAQARDADTTIDTSTDTTATASRPGSIHGLFELATAQWQLRRKAPGQAQAPDDVLDTPLPGSNETEIHAHQ